jgi:hypothetical protein
MRAKAAPAVPGKRKNLEMAMGVPKDDCTGKLRASGTATWHRLLAKILAKQANEVSTEMAGIAGLFLLRLSTTQPGYNQGSPTATPNTTATTAWLPLF